MVFMYILSWVALILQVVFVTISIVAGLYYIAELVEEYTTAARKVLAYFTICLWMVPFALFVSLSANDNVLPTTINDRHVDQDVVSNYFSRSKKQGLLSLFNYLKESVMPERTLHVADKNV
uniref:Protein TEX261 n=1 Tax=Glossina brevipalpis TaxID=37001 RepID=A0A1A9WIG4_9MUSC